MANERVQTGVPKGKLITRWLSLTIENKLKVIAAMGVMIILLSLLLDVWTMKISVVDFSYALSSNEKVGNVVQTFESESLAFKNYIDGTLSYEELKTVVSMTDEAVKELPSDYGKIGEERFAWTSSIKNAYSVYRRSCNEFLALGENNINYLTQEYMLFDMQTYLKSYASTLLALTTVSSNVLYQRMFPRLIIIPAIIIGIAAILIWIIYRTSKIVNNTFIDPLLKLAAASKRIEHNDIHFEDIEVENKDEIGDLVHAFNKMKKATGEYITTLEQNQETLDKLHAEELQKKEIENQLEKMKLEVLRHQINPHFLFNTLNVISGMARLEDAETTEKMIKSLSSLFRYNLRTNEKETLVEQEMNVIRDYMYLQEMRFGERIKYEIECDPDVKNAYIPSFIVQPFVENSIVHGLADKEEGGFIRITAKKVTKDIDKLIITISDTGRGMDEEELKELKNKLFNEHEINSGIGISNIYRRLTLMYPDSIFELESKKNEGTTIRIEVPFTRNTEI